MRVEFEELCVALGGARTMTTMLKPEQMPCSTCPICRSAELAELSGLTLEAPLLQEVIFVSPTVTTTAAGM